VTVDLRVEGATLDGVRVAIDIADGRVSAIHREQGREAGGGGESAAGDVEARRAWSAGEGRGGSADRGTAGMAPAGRVLHGAGCAAFPGFRNAHTHAAMTLLRGFGDDMPLDAWLRTRIWPAEARLTEEDVYAGTRLALLEMVRSGTTYLNDMYWHRPGVRRAVLEMGLRAHLGSPFVDFGDEARGSASRALALAEIEAVGDDGAMVRLALAPHAIYTVSPENLRWIADLAREHDLMVHIHLSETAQEVRDCVAAHGVRPAFLLERCGLLETRLVCAHAVHLDDAERGALAAAGSTAVTNPTANMKLAVGGAFDVPAARAAGLRVALGTDGPASNNNLDMIEEMRTLSLLQKHSACDPAVLPAREALALATAGPLPGMLAQPGAVRVGDPADLVLVRMDAPETAPAHDEASALVYAASGAHVDTTICAGRVLMHGRVVEVVDEGEVVAEATERALALAARSRSA
jgi:5-methylthioadenosine/S-adenosylhomocysteine deaminase